MKEIGASEARRKLSQLLNRAEAGGEVVITRRGKPLAKLVSPDAGFDADRARAAVARIRARRHGVTLGVPSIKDLINEGRP
jgi:prevent-host-death family protein